MILSYEFSDYVVNGPEDSVKIDSYMILEDDLQKVNYAC